MTILKQIRNNKAFTLIELLVVIAIIAILAAIVLFGATQYINKGKDAKVKGNLAILITAGEVWYDKTSNGTYEGFCDSETVANTLSNVPSGDTEKGCAISVGNTAWSVCAKEFVNNAKAYCVDNKGNQKEINYTDCANIINGSVSNCCFVGINNCIP